MMQFEIKKYAIVGGEDLNAPAKVSETVTEENLQLFYKWAPKLLTKTSVEQYLDLPVDENTRLHICRYELDREAQRRLFYYVGFFLDKEIYAKAGSIFNLSEIMSNLSLENDILTAIDDNMRPLSVSIKNVEVVNSSPIEFPLIKVGCGANFEASYKNTLESLNEGNIESWFQEAFIAINPAIINLSYNVVMAEQTPASGYQKPFRAPQEASSSTVDFDWESLWEKAKPIILAIIGALAMCFVYCFRNVLGPAIKKFFDWLSTLGK